MHESGRGREAAGTATMIRDLLTAVAPRHRLLILVLLVGLSLTEGAGILLLLPLLEIVGVDGGAASSDRATQVIASVFSLLTLRPTLAMVLAIYVGIAALQSTLQRWQAITSARVEQDIAIALRQRLYKAIADVQWVFFVRHRSSEFTHALTTEVDRACAAGYLAIDVAVATGIVLVYFAIAFWISPAITFVVATFGLVIAFAMKRRLQAARRSGHQLSKAAGDMHAGIVDHLASMKTAVCYGAEQRHSEGFARLTDELRAARINVASNYARFRQMLAVASTAGLAVVVYVALRIVAVPTAELLVLVFAFARLMPRTTGVFEKIQSLVAHLPAFAMIRDLDQRCRNARRPPVREGQVIQLRETIRFDGVSYDYESGGYQGALDKINLTIRAASTTAIVGPSGAGKTTIADLLLGLLMPSEGQISIDGVALGPDVMASWRSEIGYVPQETFLFHDTVRANLLWARPDASDPELWNALQLASADGFVSALAAGLDTVVGDRGVLLSGGERQRLSLARALLRQPKILILDEATSSLDSQNEARIQSAIDGLHRRITILVITHRLATIRHADTIYVVERGRLVQSGTWMELTMQRSGHFHDLWQAQLLTSRSEVHSRPSVDHAHIVR